MANTQQPEAPKIEFPLDYPIKVIGDNHEAFAARVIAVVKLHDPKFTGENLVPIPSKKGTFVSLRFSIWAIGEDQLKAMHQALLKVDGVKMVL